MFYNGPVMVSTGQRVTEWTARQAMTVNQAKLVNANANTTVTVSGKNVKFSARTAKEALVA